MAKISLMEVDLHLRIVKTKLWLPTLTYLTPKTTLLKSNKPIPMMKTALQLKTTKEISKITLPKEIITKLIR